MVFLACAGISGLVLSGLVDSFGRRKSILTFQTISNFAHVMILFSSNYTVRLLCFALMGISQVKNG